MKYVIIAAGGGAVAAWLGFAQPGSAQDLARLANQPMRAEAPIAEARSNSVQLPLTTEPTAQATCFAVTPSEQAEVLILVRNKERPRTESLIVTADVMSRAPSVVGVGSIHADSISSVYVGTPGTGGISTDNTIPHFEIVCR